jgi:hypothetical protein
MSILTFNQTINSTTSLKKAQVHTARCLSENKFGKAGDFPKNFTE